MNSNPTVVVAQEPSKRFKLPKLPKINPWIVSSFLVLALSLGSAYYLPKLVKKPSPAISKQVTLTPTPNSKEDLEQSIQQTFKDPKDQDIIKYISFASEDITLDTKFVDYSKAYQLIYQRYTTPSATIPVKKALIKLRAYLKAYPQFKETDFKLPK